MMTTRQQKAKAMSGLVAPYYDILYADKDFQAEADYVASLLNRYGDCPKSILEFGSRTGKCERALVAMGYDVTRVTTSQEMAAEAGSRVRSGESGNAEIGAVDLGQTFDAVVLLDRAMSYHTRDSDLLAVFDNAALHLDTGGLLLFDVWYGPAVLARGLETRVQRVADEHVEVTCITEPHVCSEWNGIQIVYTLFVRDKRDGRIREIDEMHTMRYFTIPEIRTIAHSRGLEVVRAEGWLIGGLPCTDTRGACIVTRKR